MNVNEKYSVQITGMTAEGEGVARIAGEAVFVPGAIPGETCRIRIVNIGKTCAHAVLERVEIPSPHRVKPACPFFENCGGCEFWHMAYEMETACKRQRVYDALQRIGGVEPGELPIHAAPTCEGYRNKVQFPVQAQNGKPVAGFYGSGTHRVVPVSACKIQPVCAGRIRDAVLDWMEQYHIRAYDETNHTGYIRHIYVRCGFASGQIMACIVANCEQLPKRKQLVQALLTAEPKLTTVIVSYNQKKGNTVLGDRFETLYGEGFIEDSLCGLRFRLSPAAFYQVNHDQAEKLYEKAVEFAGLTGVETVLDLYCGTGTITLCLAKKARRAVGVEIVAPAIADAKQNAVRNGADNAEFFCMDAGAAARMFADRGERPDVIVVDPPRKGVSRDVIDAMAAMQPGRIVYVSCDPATLARDVKLLEEAGYRYQKAEAFDLFPRCRHVETACLLTQKATVHKMKLAPGPFAMIKSGDKTIELRLFDEKRQKIKVGDSIVFTETVTGEKLSTKVEKLHRFASFAELYKSLPLLKCGYTEETIPYAKPSDMVEYYSAEKQNKYGVVGIEISRPKQITDEAIVQLVKKAENQGL